MNLSRKTQLENELTSMATDEPEKNALLAEECMEDYLTLIKE